MNTIELKCWPVFFQAISDGRKTFDARVNDRDFQEGDMLLFKEYFPATQTYSGREVARTAGFILHGPGFGVEQGHCVISLLPLDF